MILFLSALPNFLVLRRFQSSGMSSSRLGERPHMPMSSWKTGAGRPQLSSASSEAESDEIVAGGAGLPVDARSMSFMSISLESVMSFGVGSGAGVGTGVGVVVDVVDG